MHFQVLNPQIPYLCCFRLENAQEFIDYSKELNFGGEIDIFFVDKNFVSQLIFFFPPKNVETLTFLNLKPTVSHIYSHQLDAK